MCYPFLRTIDRLTLDAIFFKLAMMINCFYQILFDNYLLMKTLFASERKFFFIADKRVLNAKLKKAVGPIKISFYSSLFVFSR